MDKNQKDKKAAKREDKSKEKNAKTKEDKKPKKEKKTEDKKSADKEKVKRPCGAYILFGKDERPKIMKEHPDIKNTEIMRLIGEAWGKLPDDQKKKYQDLADKDKERYGKRELISRERRRKEAKARSLRNQRRLRILLLSPQTATKCIRVMGTVEKISTEKELIYISI